MRFLFFILLLLIIPFINSCKDDDLLEDGTTISQEKETENTVENSYIPGKIRVKFSQELALQVQTTVKATNKSIKNNSNITKTEVKSVDNALSSLNVTGLKRTFPYCGKFEQRTHDAGLDRWYDITFDKSKSLTKANNDLEMVDGIDIVEYIPIIKISDHSKNTFSPSRETKSSSNIVKTENNDIYPFNDPMLKDQWHYYNNGLNYNDDPDSNMKKGCDINVLPVWENYTTGNEDVIVAVIDFGIDMDHEDLADNIWINSYEKNGSPGIDDDNNGYIDDY